MKKPISYGTCGTSRNPLVLESVSLLAKNPQDLLLSILNLKTEKALGNKEDLKGSRYVGTPAPARLSSVQAYPAARTVTVSLPQSKQDQPDTTQVKNHDKDQESY